MSLYSIIYADPPWTSRKSEWGGNNHYPQMKLSDMCAMPIKDIAAENSVLFMWVVNCHLENSFQLIKAWGFEYKTVGFNWAKIYRDGSPVSGLGHWTKQGSELCLLATRGTPKRVSKAVRQLIFEPVIRHSQKPADIRNRIVELCGDLPRIELFARQRVAGWDVFGNEVEGSIRLPTPHAPDIGESAALSSIFLPSEVSALQAESTPAPTQVM